MNHIFKQLLWLARVLKKNDIKVFKFQILVLTSHSQILCNINLNQRGHLSRNRKNH